MTSDTDWLAIGDEVGEAIGSGRPVVVLESSLIAHGLPAPHNLETALAAEAAVREAGAIPATTAIAGGRAIVGADRALLERLAGAASNPAKAASRDLGPLLAGGGLGATTVSATVRIAAAAGLRVAATGGIGGVHRGADHSFDVSADIEELAATPVAVVCSGAKAILDLPATFELLETKRIPVVGLQTDELPGFYSATTGLPLAHRVETTDQAARVVRAHLALPGGGGILIVRPPPAEVAIDAAEIEAWIATGLGAAGRDRIRGSAVTPFVLERVVAASDGRALRANIGLIVANARAAGELAVALATLS